MLAVEQLLRAPGSRRLLSAAHRRGPACPRRARRRCRDRARLRALGRARACTSCVSCSRRRSRCAGEAAGEAGRGELQAAAADLRVSRRLHVPDDLQVRAMTIGRADGVTLTGEQQRCGLPPSRAAAAVGGGRQRQDLGARGALRRGGARGRHRARADPRDHVHRARRRRAARARTHAPARARRPRGRARHGGCVRRHLPRLLRAAAARAFARRRTRPRRSRSSTRVSRGVCASWRSRRRCASSSPASAARRWTCSPPTASTACAGCSSRCTESCAAAGNGSRACLSREHPRAGRGRRRHRRRSVGSALDADALARACCSTSCSHASALAYERLKSERAAVDFDDLELLAGELLAQRDGVRGAWSDRFELLMVDEFQDTNPRQLAILQALDRGNLFTVGDELQSIYGFRHADVSLFRARHAELAAARREHSADTQLPQPRAAARRRQRGVRRSASPATRRCSQAGRDDAPLRAGGLRRRLGPGRSVAGDAGARPSRRSSCC